MITNDRALFILGSDETVSPSAARKPESLPPSASLFQPGGSCTAPLLTAWTLWNTQKGGQCSSEADQIRRCYWFTQHTVIQTLSKWVIGSIIRPQIKVWRTSEHAETSFFLQVTSRQKHRFITEQQKKKIIIKTQEREETADDRRVFTIETLDTKQNPPSGHDATVSARHCG